MPTIFSLGFEVVVFQFLILIS